jgi:hypothetical protein
LIDIGLTRGVGADDSEFAESIAYISPRSVQQAYFFGKLQRLAATEGPTVRDAACKELAAYRQKCVEWGGKP